jgi:hypothetical protein
MDIEMWKFTVAISFMCGAISFADKPAVAPEKVPLVRVECHGKLRHGVVAIGGETTGTTITFDGLTWELKLPDEPSRTFAKEHHKSPVTAVGTLRRVAGHEKSVRWIVDVERISERDASEQTEATMITIEGQLRTDDTVPGKTPSMELESAGITWALDLTAESALSAKAESLVGKSAVVTGRLVPDTKAEPPTLVIRVNALNAPMVAHPPQ